MPSIFICPGEHAENVAEDHCIHDRYNCVRCGVGEMRYPLCRYHHQGLCEACHSANPHMQRSTSCCTEQMSCPRKDGTPGPHPELVGPCALCFCCQLKRSRRFLCHVHRYGWCDQCADDCPAIGQCELRWRTGYALALQKIVDAGAAAIANANANEITP